MSEPMSRLRRRRVLIENGLRERSIYLLPNLFTTAALFAGFYAIVQSMNGRFEHAAVAIFIAMVLDGLDGRVARLTNTQSAFGAEYDTAYEGALDAARRTLLTMRDAAEIGDDAFHALENELDWLEASDPLRAANADAMD